MTATVSFTVAIPPEIECGLRRVMANDRQDYYDWLSSALEQHLDLEGRVRHLSAAPDIP